MNKHEETLEIWEKLADEVDHVKYDFSKLEIYLDFFDNIASEYKEEEMRRLIMAIVMYLHSKEEKIKQKNTLSQDKKLLNSLIDAMEFLETEDAEKIMVDDISDLEITRKTIRSLFDTINGKPSMFMFFPSNKSAIKSILKGINEKYELKSTLAVKQLVDAI